MDGREFGEDAVSRHIAHGRYCDGVWWISIGGRVASARTLGEAIERALCGGLN